ncbi:MAG: hypothetical protein AAB390_04925 [Patescibacteria group bacterium]
MRKIIVYFSTLAVLCWPLSSIAQMTGGSFSIPVDSLTISDSAEVDGGVYALDDSTGYGEMSTSTSNTYVLNAGFQQAIGNSVTLNLSSATVSLGALSPTAVATSALTATVSTESITGYTLSVSEDGNLRTGSETINDVADGAVTAGAEEYGIRTSGTNALLNSADTAISNNLNIASNSASVGGNAITINFKAAISTATVFGSYSHIVTFTLTANP